MNISIEINNRKAEIIKEYAKKNRLSVSKLVRNVIMEKIEDEYDLECYKKAIASYKKNPKTYTLDEIKNIYE